MSAKIIVVDSYRTQRGSQVHAANALDAGMGLGGCVFDVLKDTGSFILSHRGRKRQPSYAESILTGRKPDVRLF
jgi:hypothetical protein